MTMLDVRNLSVSFTHYGKGLAQHTCRVIHNLQVAVEAGEVLAVVGSSGSGKSLLAHGILGILPQNAIMTGEILYQGEVLSENRQKELRGQEIVLVPQSVNFLNPLAKVGKQVQWAAGAKDGVTLQKQVFSRYGLADQVSELLPFQLSGGMARRVLVSTAVVSGARLVIADEPTPGLDAAALRETLGFFREMADEGRGVMMITHDMESALQIADKIAVFYAGTTVEVAPAKNFAGKGELLRHPYSRALWQALPKNGFVPIPGFQPPPGNQTAGCLFQPRCAEATEQCLAAEPGSRKLRGGMVRCFHAS